MLASTLIKKGYEVDILNLNHLILKKAYHFSGNIFPFDKIWEEELKKKISEFNPDFIGLTCMFSQTHVALQLVTKKIRELLPDSLISIGGVHVSNALADIITAKTLISELYEADFFFLYEGDNVFLEFINFLNNFSDKEYKPAQLFVKNLNTVYCFKNKNIPSVQEISLPPRHDLLDTGELSKYGKIGAFYCHLPKGTKITTVLSNVLRLVIHGLFSVFVILSLMVLDQLRNLGSNLALNSVAFSWKPSVFSRINSKTFI